MDWIKAIIFDVAVQYGTIGITTQYLVKTNS